MLQPSQSGPARPFRCLVGDFFRRPRMSTVSTRFSRRAKFIKKLLKVGLKVIEAVVRYQRFQHG